MVEELEESIWSVVRQKNERAYQGEDVQDIICLVVRPALVYGVGTFVLKKAQESKLEAAEMRML